MATPAHAAPADAACSLLLVNHEMVFEAQQTAVTGTASCGYAPHAKQCSAEEHAEQLLMTMLLCTARCTMMYSAQEYKASLRIVT